MTGGDFLRNLADDGLFTPGIKTHSLEKIRLHNYYAELFTTSMKALWPQRAYLGLYSGAGRARLDDTGEIVETTAMSVFRLRDTFTKYIFVDNETECIDALRQRITALPTQYDLSLICADVASALPRIKDAIPRFGPNNGLLSFCFIDPFAADLDFRVIKGLAAYRMDFLILLMLGRDIRTNFKRYHDDPHDNRIATLIDDPDWRSKWAREGQSGQRLIRFLLTKFDEGMTRLGYHAAKPDESHPIRVAGKKVLLYSLVFYSKHPRGKEFWQATRTGSTPQISLGI